MCNPTIKTIHYCTWPTHRSSNHSSRIRRRSKRRPERASELARSKMAYLSMGEAHRRITEYLNRFSDAVSSQDGPSLKPLLAVSSNSPHLLSLADSLNIFQVDWLTTLPCRFSIDFRVLGFFLTPSFSPQDASRLIKQSDKYSQIGDVLLPLLRSLQSFRIRRFVDAYIAYEKSSKYRLSLSHLVLGLISLRIIIGGVLTGWLQCVSSGIPQLGVGVGDGSCLRDRLWD